MTAKKKKESILERIAKMPVQAALDLYHQVLNAPKVVDFAGQLVKAGMKEPLPGTYKNVVRPKPVQGVSVPDKELEKYIAPGGRVKHVLDFIRLLPTLYQELEQTKKDGRYYPYFVPKHPNLRFGPGLTPIVYEQGAIDPKNAAENLAGLVVAEKPITAPVARHEIRHTQQLWQAGGVPEGVKAYIREVGRVKGDWGANKYEKDASNFGGGNGSALLQELANQAALRAFGGWTVKGKGNKLPEYIPATRYWRRQGLQNMMYAPVDQTIPEDQWLPSAWGGKYSQARR